MTNTPLKFGLLTGESCFSLAGLRIIDSDEFDTIAEAFAAALWELQENLVGVVEVTRCTYSERARDWIAVGNPIRINAEEAHWFGCEHPLTEACESCTGFGGDN